MTGNLIEIAHFYKPVEAHLAAAFLSSHGIESFISDDQVASLHLWYACAIGGVKLRVRASDAEKATLLVREYYASLEKPDDANDEGDWGECPSCGGSDVELYHKRTALTRAWQGLLTLFFCTVPIYQRGPYYRCKACRSKWS